MSPHPGKGSSPVLLADALLVIATGTPASARIMRLLAEAGLRVRVMGARSLPERWSRFARVLDGGDSPGAILDSCERHLEQHEYSLVIFADESCLHLLFDDPARFPHCAKWIPVPRERLSLIASKHEFIRMAQRFGVQVPRSELVTNSSQAVAVSRQFGFPVLLKLSKGAAGSGVLFCKDVADVINKITEGEPTLVQQFVEGTVGCTSVLFHRGKPIRWLSCAMTASWPTPFSPATILLPVQLSGEEDFLIKIGSLSKFHGLAGIDWVVPHGTKKPLLLEINARPTQSVYLGRRESSRSFSTGLAQFLNKHSVNLPLARGSYLSSPYYLFPNHLHWALDRCDFIGACRSLSNAPWDDPLLTLAQLIQLAYQRLPERIRGWIKKTS